jgi:hypothetical protein
VAKTRSGNFIGSFGECQILMLTRSWKNVIKLISLYTSTILETITRIQMEKWESSMNLPVSDIKEGISVLFKSRTLFKLKAKYPRVCHLIESQIKPTLEKRTFPELEEFFNSGEYRRFRLEHPWLSKRFFENVYKERKPDDITPSKNFNNIPMFWKASKTIKRSWALMDKATYFLRMPYSMGRVGFTQEPGGKLRVYFDPKLYFQGMLQPLRVSLDKLLSTLPWDCTHLQGKAIPAIQERLRLGKKVYSFDLSDATNIFPWGLQHLVLSQIYGLIPVVRLMSSIVDSGIWDGPEGTWFFQKRSGYGS